MTQELIDLRNSILEGRYNDALEIVDELEGMSKLAILRNIQAYLRVFLIYLIKNQIEQRLTNSWVASIRNSLREIQKLNLKANKKSYYINLEEWDDYLEDELEAAIRDASLEVANGVYNEFELLEMVDRNQLKQTGLKFLTLIYSYSVRELPTVIAENLTNLPGGEDWKSRKQ
ncbi:MAG TPA: hypothetical protein VK184_17265 [Nostocaceae cyanobacterium]|nr:hypothetical protein [Nostocaceae cyanobacterium]